MFRPTFVAILWLGIYSTAHSVDARRQFNILTNIQEQTSQLKRNIVSKGSNANSKALSELHEMVLSSSKIDPSKGKWKGNFVKALDDRKALESKWKDLKRQLNHLENEEAFKQFSKDLDDFLNLRKEGDYARSNRLMKSSQYQEDYQAVRNLLKLPKTKISDEKLQSYNLNVRDLLDELSPENKATNRKGDQEKSVMALSSKVAPETTVDQRIKSSSAWGLFRIGVFICFGICVLIFGMKSLGKNHGDIEQPEQAKEANLIDISSKSSARSSVPKNYSLKAECIHRLSDHYFQERLFSSLSNLDQHSPEFESAKNIIVTRLNMIIADISQCNDSDFDTLRDNLKSNFRTLQAYVKALKSGDNPSRANQCIINSFRIILEEMRDLGDSLKQNVS